MSKQVLKIDDFSGGLVTNLNPRDIPDNASPESINISLWRPGQVALGWYLKKGLIADFTQQSTAHVNITNNFAGFAMNPGTELFAFASDYDNCMLSSDETSSFNPSVYIVWTDYVGRIRIAQTTIANGTFSGWNEVTSGQSPHGLKFEMVASGMSDDDTPGEVSYFSVDDAIRISPGDLDTSDNFNLWRGRISRTLMPSTVANFTTRQETLGSWFNEDQEIKAAPSGDGTATSVGSSHSEMTQDYFTFVDTGDVSYTGSNDEAFYQAMELDHTDDTKNFVVLGLRDEKTSAGTFPAGGYHAGMSLIYDGVQESPITVAISRGSSTGAYKQFDIPTANEGSALHASLALNWPSDVGVTTDRVTDSFMRGNKRITGVRIYLRSIDDLSKWVLIMDASLTHGVKQNTVEGLIENSWRQANGAGTDAEGSSTDINQENWIMSFNQTYYGWPVETYEIINQHAQGEINYATFKTSLIANRRTWIGNIYQNGRHYPDRLMYSPTDQYDKFPELNFVPVVPADGDEIIKIIFNDDRIFVFKKHALLIVNIAQDGGEYLEATYNGLGANSKSEVCKVGDGIAWVNYSGVYYFDGQKVNHISAPINNLWYRKGSSSSSANIVSNDFSLQDKAISGARTADANYTFYSGNSAIGYDALSKKIVIMQDTTGTLDSNGFTGSLDSFLVYDMVSNIWEFKNEPYVDKVPQKAGDMTSGNGTPNHAGRKSGFVQNPLPNHEESLFYIKYADFNDNAVEEIVTLSIVDSSHYSETQNIFTYFTKDFDFGSPSVRKKIYKIYITYTTNNDSGVNVNVTYDTNGGTSFAKTFKGNNDYYNGTTLAQADGWQVAELKPTTPSEANNIYSFQLKICTDPSTSTNATTPEFKINDISIVYKTKRVK